VYELLIVLSVKVGLWSYLIPTYVKHL
jgi:hypothetical protein